MGVVQRVNLAAYLEGGPACTSVGALTLRAGLAHVPIGPSSSYIQHSAHNIGQCGPDSGPALAVLFSVLVGSVALDRADFLVRGFFRRSVGNVSTAVLRIPRPSPP